MLTIFTTSFRWALTVATVLISTLLGCCPTSTIQPRPELERPVSNLSLSKPALGAVLLIHGLNLRPSAMDQLANALNQHGFHTRRMVLSGHEIEDHGIFPAAEWVKQAQDECMRLRNAHPDLPTYVLGFSLGGLITVRMFDDPTIPAPQGLILLAPPLSLRLLPQSARILQLFGPLRLRVCNIAPAEYRRFSATPLFWYRNVMDLYGEIKELKHPEILRKIPGIIAMSSDDELVSLCGLRDWLSENKLDQAWRVVEITPHPDGNDLWNHLLIDRRSLGDREWERLVEVVTGFTKDRTSAYQVQDDSHIISTERCATTPHEVLH